jgi:hypothetical protein
VWTAWKRDFPATVLETILESAVKPVTSVSKGPLGEEARCAAARASARFACLLVRRIERIAAWRLLQRP